MPLPENYHEKVYAGILGKIIGVYLGRPFENWTYERIMAELGEIEYYVNERVPGNHPLVVTDDDITGTFTFLRALEDYGVTREITPAQIGQTWLNYVIEERTIFWWGGFGNSTEHTAYLRLKNGIQAPRSGSMALNGKIVAEQVGAQIFIDGWAMVAPGDPELAVELAGKAASVSHDGEAVYAAQVLAAMESAAFVETDINNLLDLGVSFIPKDSTIFRMIADIREWHAGEADWHKGRQKLAGVYNYQNYGGVCHMVPNHGLIILALLYGGGDFDQSMRVVNTAGWDTDCNAGNLGCLLGIRGGLAAFEGGRDWRGPVVDRFFMPAADGGRAISDAVIEAQKVINMGRTLAGEAAWQPKDGARFHFEFPGSLQGFRIGEAGTKIENVAAESRKDMRTLQASFSGAGSIYAPTFIQPDELDMGWYKLIASPTLYAGQTIRAGLSADVNASVRPFLRIYNQADQLDMVAGPEVNLAAGEYSELTWQIPDTHSQPIAGIGFEWLGPPGALYLDYLDWAGEADVLLTRPAGSDMPNAPPLIWRQAWVDGMDLWKPTWQEPFRLAQNAGRGLIIQGTREWRDYEVTADITPWLAAAAGIGARVQGMRRFYALQLAAGQKIRLIKTLDGDKVLAEKEFPWVEGRQVTLKLRVQGSRIAAWVNSELQFELEDTHNPLTGGGAAYVLDQGCMSSQAMRIKPAAN